MKLQSAVTLFCICCICSTQTEANCGDDKYPLDSSGVHDRLSFLDVTDCFHENMMIIEILLINRDFKR